MPYTTYMNCPNCKKDLVTGFECDNAACVAIRPQGLEGTPFVVDSVDKIKSIIKTVRRATKK